MSLVSGTIITTGKRIVRIKNKKRAISKDTALQQGVGVIWKALLAPDGAEACIIVVVLHFDEAQAF